ncbi:MAG: Ppx/GppA family phosphatase [Pseudomonadota bacterium]
MTPNLLKWFETPGPIGIVDIGSNSVRLVVYSGLARTPAVLCNEKVACGLGRALAANDGRLAGPSADRAFDAMRRFRALAHERLGVATIVPFATAAVRRASDGPWFLQRASDILGVQVDLVSEEREAELAAFGVRAGFSAPRGVVGDLGGGSLELIPIDRDDIGAGRSLPIGALTLLAQTGGDPKRARKLVGTALETQLITPAARGGWTPSDVALAKGRPFYAVGGTWRAIAKLHMAAMGYPLSILHAYKLPIEGLITFLRQIQYAPDIAKFPGVDRVSKSRTETLGMGAALLERIVRHFEPSEVVISANGVRDGVLYERLPDAEKRQDPLLSACEDMARRRSRAVEYGHELADWTDVLFGQLAAATGRANMNGAHARMRRASCLLNDVQWRAGPDMRAINSVELVTNGRFVAVSHAERAFMARSLYHWYAGVGAHTEVVERLSGLLSSEHNRDAQILGAAMRAAYALSLGQPRALPHAAIALSPDLLTLTLDAPLHALVGERVHSRFARLAKALTRSLRIELRDRRGGAQEWSLDGSA